MTSTRRSSAAFASRTSSLALALALAAGTADRAQAGGPNATPVIAIGSGAINVSANQTLISVTTTETVVEWTTGQSSAQSSFDFLPAGQALVFQGLTGQPSYTVLNRISSNFGTPQIEFNGAVESSMLSTDKGNIWFYAPGGLLIGPTATFNVGSLILTTDDIQIGQNLNLFGANGEIQFRGASGSQSAVKILPGAQINVGGDSSYVAIVAPRVEQGGTINVDGSTALVAAEQADVIINAGLFDINVLIGSDDANGIVHTGTTTGPSLSSGPVTRRIAMVAVPKNTAMTMLLSGTIGYQQAQNAQEDGSAVMLGAGLNLNGDSIGNSVGNATASIHIADTNFLSRVGTGLSSATATGDIEIAPDPLGTTEFVWDTAFRAMGNLTVRAQESSTVQFDQNAFLTAGVTNTGGTITLEALGQFNSQNPVGKITSQALTLDASGIVDGNSFSTVGETGTGGNILVNINGGQLTATSFSATANGSGGAGDQAGGDGIGGSVVLTAVNHGDVALNDVFLSANGQGGASSSGFGGTGHGGQATINATDSTLAMNALTLLADGAGGNFSNGGAGLSGNVDLTLSGGSSTFLSISAEASAIAGTGAEPGMGGSATGASGAIQMTFTDNTAVTISDGVTLTANALTPRGVVQANTNIIAGGIEFGVQSGVVNIGGLFAANADAVINPDSLQGLVDISPTMFAGSVAVSATGGSLFLDRVEISASAEGIPAFVTAGDAFGGTIDFSAASGGTIGLFDSGLPVALSLRAVGLTNSGDVSSNATGGQITVFAQDGTIEVQGPATLDAGARVGSESVGPDSHGRGGGATGGDVFVQIRSGANGTGAMSFGAFTASAEGLANTYDGDNDGIVLVNGDGGAGIGGTVQIELAAGTFNATSMQLSAMGAGSASYASDLSTTGYLGGSGIGGTVDFRVDGGTASTSSLSIEARGIGAGGEETAASGLGAARGGSGSGGQAGLNVLGGRLDVTGNGVVVIDAGALGGSGMDSTDTAAGLGGNAFSGTASFTETGVGTVVVVPALRLDAVANGGDGGGTVSGTAGNGGTGTAGTAMASIADGAFNLGGVSVRANSSGGTGVVGGDAIGGAATFALADVNLTTNLPAGFSRTISNLSLAGTGTGGSDIIGNGDGTAGTTALTVAVDVPSAGLTIGGIFAATAQGDHPAASGNGFALDVSGQIFTVASNAIVDVAGPVSLSAGDTVFQVAGNLTVTTPSTLTGTGQINLTGDSALQGTLGIDLEQLASGGATTLTATNGAILVRTGLQSNGIVSALGTSLDLRGPSDLHFGSLIASDGLVAVTTGGSARFDNALTGTNVAVTTGGAATFSGAISSTTATLQIGTSALFQDAVTTTGAFIINTGGDATFNGAVNVGSGDFDIGGLASFADVLSASNALRLTALGGANFAGSVTGGTIDFDVTGVATFASLESDGALTLTTSGDASLQSVTAGGATTIDIGGGGNFGGAIAVTNGPLAISTGDDATFAGAISAPSATMILGGAATFARSLQTTGAIDVTAGSATFADVLAGGNGRFQIGAGATFGGVLRTIGDLLVVTGGAATFNDDVQAASATIGIGGTATFLGSVTGSNELLITTGGDASFAGTVFGDSATLTIDGDARFDGELDGTTAVTLVATGDAIFGARTGARTTRYQVDGLARFDGAVEGTDITLDVGTADLRSTIAADNSLRITTQGNATFADLVYGDRGTLVIGGDVTFGGRFDGTTSLTLTTTGNATFADRTGAATLDYDIGGTGRFDGLVQGTTITLAMGTADFRNDVGAGGALSITSRGDASFQALGAGGAMSIDVAGAGTFGGTVLGDALTLRTGGGATFAAAVGGRTGAITVGGNATFQDSVSTSEQLALTTTGTATFQGLVSGAQELDVTTGGGASFGGQVFGGQAILTIGGDASFGGRVDATTTLAVTTTGNATFAAGVNANISSFRIGGDALFQGLLGGLDTLTVRTGRSAIFRGNVSGGDLIFDIGTTARFDGALAASVDIDFLSGGNATFSGAVSADPARFRIGGDALFGSTVFTDQDLAITTTGSARFLGTVRAGRTTFSFGNGATFLDALTLTGLLDLTANGPVSFGSRVTTNGLNLTLPGDILFSDALTSAAPLSISATGSATFAGTVTAPTIALTAGTDLSLNNGATASGALTLNAARNLTLGGAITAGTTLDLTAGGLARITGTLGAPAIVIRSQDIDIGTSAVIGDRTQTNSISLLPAANVVVVGGSGSTSGYSLSNAEFSRLRASQLIEIAQGGQGNTQFTVADLDVSALGRGGLGAQGKLRLSTNGVLSVTGKLDFQSADTNATLELVAPTLRVRRDTGSIALHDANGALQGKLLLTGNAIEVASEAAFADLATLTDLTQIAQRLARIEGTPSEMGAISASQIVISATGHLYVQNSAASDGYSNRRGLTAASLQILTGQSLLDTVINARIADGAGGYFAGSAASQKIQVSRSSGGNAPYLSSASLINGCAFAATCFDTTEMPVLPEGTLPPAATLQTIAATIESNKAKDPQAFEMTPIQLGNATVLDTTPVVDEPVTSVGNDDLWQSGCDPANLQACSPAPQ